MPVPTETATSARLAFDPAEPPLWRPRPVLVAVAWLSVVLWAATIHWFSARTGPEIEEMNIFELSDKIAHFIAFFAGAPALVCALRWSTRWTWKRLALTSAAVLALYGAADEYHQTFTPNRTGADVYDWTGDALGGLSGSLLAVYFYARFERSSRPRRPASAGD